VVDVIDADPAFHERLLAEGSLLKRRDGRSPTDARGRTAIAPCRGDQIPPKVIVRGSNGPHWTVPLHPEAHDALRRWYTRCSPNAASPGVIRALAGHIDVGTTQIYVDVTDQNKATALARWNTPPSTGGVARTWGPVV